MEKANRNNKRNKKKIVCILLILIVLVIVVITFFILNHSKIENTDVLGNASNVKTARERNPENYTEVESLDGIKVPVPTGYVASSVESEMYVNGLNIEHRGTSKELELSSSGVYVWTKNEDGVWVSGNYNVGFSTSTLESEEFTIGENGGHLKVNWSVSSQIADMLYLIITNIETGESNRCANISDTDHGTAYSSLIYTDIEKELEAGKYKILLEYVKDERSNSGLDAGYVKSVEIINYSGDGTGEAVGIEHKYGGLVIYEGEEEVTEGNVEIAQKTRNQWVWVPVNDVSRICSETNGVKNGKSYSYNFTGRISNAYVEPRILSSYDNEYYFSRYGLLGMTREKFYQDLQIEFEETIESIKAYGGFYIGRYETGNISQNFPVVQKGNTDIGDQTWYEMYGKMEAMAMHESVKSNMIWGCLWDETLEWLVESGSKTYAELKDSGSWGNYNGATFSYANSSGSIVNKAYTVNTRIPSGSTEYTKANNVYDMAGNVSDWTLESQLSLGRCLRGGSNICYGSDYPGSCRSVSFPYSGTNSGFRAYFYIK